MKKFKKPNSRPSAPSARPAFKKSQKPSAAPRSSAPQGKGQPPRGRCVVGIHAVNELLSARANKVDVLWLRTGFQDHPGLVELEARARKERVKVELHPSGALDRVVSSHQGVLAWTQSNPELNFHEVGELEEATLIALDEVEDPHNLGAVMRTSWLLGGLGVLTPEHRTATLSPAVSKVAQGAVEHIPVVADGALPSQLEDFKKQGFWILGMSHKAKQDLYTLEIPKKVIWVLGSESSGLRKSVEGVCDDLVSIPQSVPEASYNVSVAAALALGETYRQRKAEKAGK